MPGFASAEEAPDYSAFGRGVYLSYVNAPRGGEPARVPKLLVSFGFEPRPVVMDTGSTGIVVSAERIPNVDSLPGRPGRLTYSSSGRVMVGRWVTTPVTIYGNNGASVSTKPIPVLAVDEIQCLEHARDCQPKEDPRGVAMMGIGFGREGDGQSESTPDTNPFLNLDAGGEPVRRGYVVTRRGVHVGLTRANTRGDFRFVKLESRAATPGDWNGAPVCITVAGRSPPACGNGLIDTGVTSMFLTVPPSAVAGMTIQNGDGRTGLADGTTVTFSFPGKSDTAIAARYDVTAGNSSALMAPEHIQLNTTRPVPFANTSVRFLDGFDILYDADGGYFAFRPRRGAETQE